MPVKPCSSHLKPLTFCLLQFSDRVVFKNLGIYRVLIPLNRITIEV